MKDRADSWIDKQQELAHKTVWLYCHLTANSSQLKSHDSVWRTLTWIAIMQKLVLRLKLFTTSFWQSSQRGQFGIQSLRRSPPLPSIAILKHARGQACTLRHTQKDVLGSVRSIRSKFVKWITEGLGHKCPTHVPNFFLGRAWKTRPD